VIHGVLHLVGFDDLIESGRDEMKRMEDFWLGKA
jgi:ssRNA-specific RNase YbeY (16S rRNA maturation enzyme)